VYVTHHVCDFAWLLDHSEIKGKETFAKGVLTEKASTCLVELIKSISKGNDSLLIALKLDQSPDTSSDLFNIVDDAFRKQTGLGQAGSNRLPKNRYSIDPTTQIIFRIDNRYGYIPIISSKDYKWLSRAIKKGYANLSDEELKQYFSIAPVTAYFAEIDKERYYLQLALK
jgi:hypothetical protein